MIKDIIIQVLGRMRPPHTLLVDTKGLTYQTVAGRECRGSDEQEPGRVKGLWDPQGKLDI